MGRRSDQLKVGGRQARCGRTGISLKFKHSARRVPNNPSNLDLTHIPSSTLLKGGLHLHLVLTNR